MTGMETFRMIPFHPGHTLDTLLLCIMSYRHPGKEDPIMVKNSVNSGRQGLAWERDHGKTH